MLAEVEIEETLIEVPGKKPELGLCGLCGFCELEISVKGTGEEAKHRLLSLFSRQCRERSATRHKESILDERSRED